jgi:phosphatidate phosphatase APP1
VDVSRNMRRGGGSDDDDDKSGQATVRALALYTCKQTQQVPTASAPANATHTTQEKSTRRALHKTRACNRPGQCKTEMGTKKMQQAFTFQI